MVRCKAADYQRKVFRARDKLGMVADASTDGHAAVSPSGPLESEETRLEVLRVLDELPDRQRLVLEWKYLDALRVREIAERLGDSEKAIETVLYRARREFRRLFEAKRPGGVALQAIHERGSDFPQQSQS